MKKLLYIIFISIFSLSCLFSCSKNTTLLNKKNPVTLTMWHVYGEQVDSPMNKYIECFNQTVGKDKGIIINVTLISNANAIGKKLLEAQSNKAGLPDMPDLFFCHNSNAQSLGIENLINWYDMLTKAEIDNFIDDFISDGIIDKSLSVLPTSKSTNLLFIAGNVFDRFASNYNITYDSLDTWDSFFEVAEKYYNWSGGKPFCAIDYLLQCVELNAISKGATNFYTSNGWYDFDNEILMKSFLQFASAIAKGHIIVSDLYANTQIMTGQVIAGIGSSASILYYNDKITYPDNTFEDINLQIHTLPQSKKETTNYSYQSGVGLCGYKTTNKKAEAMTVFARWFTQKQRNLDFVTSTGYMPVLKNSFNDISNYNFISNSYKNLYFTLEKTINNCTLLPLKNIPYLNQNTDALYKNIRSFQNNLKNKYSSGFNSNDLTQELKNIFISIK